MPERIQMTRNKPWRHLSPDAVIVDRRTKYGNPFELGKRTALARVPAAMSDAEWEYEDRISAPGMRHDFFHADGRVTRHTIRLMSLDEVLAAYREWATREVGPAHLEWANWRFTLEDVRRELRGRDLACWCKLDQPCHADVLLELANA